MAASHEQLQDPTIVEQLMHPDGVDPAQLEGQLGPDGQPINPTAPETNPPHPEAAQQLAQTALENAQRDALNRAQAPDIVTAFDEIQQDRHVADARRALEELFTPGSQADAEEKAARNAIDESHYTETQQADRVAHEVAVGASPLKTVESEVSGNVENSRQAAEQRAALENRYGKQGLRLVAPVVEQVREDLGSLGIKERRSVLRDRVIEEAGTDIGRIKQQEHTIKEQEGEALVKAFADNKPVLNTARRKEVIDTFGDNVKIFAEAVARRRHGGNVSQRTLRRVGKYYRRGRAV